DHFAHDLSLADCGGEPAERFRDEYDDDNLRQQNRERSDTGVALERRRHIVNSVMRFQTTACPQRQPDGRAAKGEDEEVAQDVPSHGLITYSTRPCCREPFAPQ